MFTITPGTFAQLVIPVQPDCDSLPFQIFKSYLKATVKAKLTGYGNTLEISGNAAQSKYYFEEEHHTTWYKFIITKTGELVMNLQPTYKADDLDFLVFNYAGDDFQQQLMRKKILPIRSNMARGDSTLLGRTGLSSAGTHAFERQGPANAYSTPMPVEKGDTIYLVVDNVHNDRGFQIEIGIQNEIQIEGTTTDENNVPIAADLLITNQNGDTIQEEKTNSSGKFDIKIKVWENAANRFTAFNDSSFYFITEINTKNEKDNAFTDINAILPKLKKGAKYPVGEINFFPNIALLLPSSYTSLEALYKLMKKNPKLKIRLEGHVNDVDHDEDPKFCQRLSDDRAKTVYRYLYGKGIAEDRMEILGLSCTYPLFPHPKSMAEESRNRRVEVNVIEY
jgi:outer membrane protein OmpA-like peptidoglycan-associated protein